MAAFLVLLLAVAGGLLLVLNVLKRDPVVVLMDTTARSGIYDPDNKEAGVSNTKELHKVLSENLLPPRSLYPVALSVGWSREHDVCSLRPDLVIVHRASFFHSYNAEFKFALPDESANDARWRFLHNSVGDDKLICLMGHIGTQVPQTKFLVYSRGIDTNWLDAEFRAGWVKRIETRFPKLTGRIYTMVIPNRYKGTFRDPKTAEELRRQVKTILGLPSRQTRLTRTACSEAVIPEPVGTGFRPHFRDGRPAVMFSSLAQDHPLHPIVVIPLPGDCGGC